MEGELKDKTGFVPLSVKIPVIEEHLHVSKHDVETGKVIISKKVVETTETVDVSEVHEELEVQRIAINKNIDTAPPAIRYEGDITIISIVKEVLVVEKRLILVEELHITRRQHTVPGEQQVTLRSEEISIERTGHEQTSLKNVQGEQK